MFEEVETTSQGGVPYARTTDTGGDRDGRVDAGFGADYVTGNDGNDTVDGLNGQDSIRGGPGTDTLDGGPGDDTIHTRDGEADNVTCGEGAHDKALLDNVDVITDATPENPNGSCERVVRADPTGGETEPS